MPAAARRTTRLTCLLVLSAISLLVGCGAPPQEQHAQSPGSGFTGNDASSVSIPAEMFGPACATMPAGDLPGSPGAIVNLPAAAAVSSIASLRGFATMIQTAGLTDHLDFSSPAITVFAPDNGALSSMHQSVQPASTSAPDRAAAAHMIDAVVVPGRNNRNVLRGAGTVPTLSGGTLTISDTSSGMTVTDSAGNIAHVVCGNLSTQNAMIFIVDKVLTGQRPGSRGTGS